jgi:hypothetical protein
VADQHIVLLGSERGENNGEAGEQGQDERTRGGRTRAGGQGEKPEEVGPGGKTADAGRKCRDSSAETGHREKARLFSRRAAAVFPLEAAGRDDPFASAL